MIAFQTVIGFFEDKAEAQQVVQRLLQVGFAPERLALTTQTAAVADTVANGETGRFLVSLFGHADNADDDKLARREGVFMTVEVGSVSEANQVADLLASAGAEAIAVLTAEASG